MQFVFSNAPARIAHMTRAVAWAALDAGHDIFEERTQFEKGHWQIELQNSAAEIPLNPFLYGHTGAVAAVANGFAPPSWHVAWDHVSFDAEQWSSIYGDRMWNNHAQFLSLGDALERWPEAGWHMRPCGADSGPKAFKGFFSNRRSLASAWAQNCQGATKNKDMRVAVSSPRPPFQEYRLAFMQRTCIDASLYLNNGIVTQQRGAPSNVWNYAMDVAMHYPLPSTHCVMDIALSLDGQMGIVEFNSLHSAGLYAMDKSRIVHAIAHTWT